MQKILKNLLTQSIYLIIVITALSKISFSQISPGDLTTAHADLEGLSNCTQCHELGEKVDNDKCLDCHEAIKTLIINRQGYHSSDEVRNKNCWDCHSEHHGRNFRIVNFNPNSFNHNKTGYKLERAHTKIDCEKCHRSKNISDIEIKKRSGTYLGLDKNCFSCHEDYHQNTLDDNCVNCHNTVAFRPAASFNHNAAKFKLTGSHKNVECSKCHPKEKRNGKDFQVFKGLNFTSCRSCHEDIHKGRFGKNCSTCHNTISFNKIIKGSFSHDKTDFPLTGRHSIVDCESCHKQNLRIELKHEKCTDCHYDYHKTQFVKNDMVMDCIECHNEYGFRPSLFSIDDHKQTIFELTGAHLATPCESCHLADENWRFRNIGKTCIDCHNNIHEEELNVKFIPNYDCTVCHNTKTWSTLSFDHTQTEFELFGKHSTISCSDCHVRIINERKQILFSSIDEDCESCHEDVHEGQFKEENEITGCHRCHSFEDWTPDNFNHDATKFPLEGAHKNVDCSQCHPKEKKNNRTFIRFKLESFKCADCHTQY